MVTSCKLLFICKMHFLVRLKRQKEKYFYMKNIKVRLFKELFITWKIKVSTEYLTVVDVLVVDVVVGSSSSAEAATCFYY